MLCLQSWYISCDMLKSYWFAEYKEVEWVSTKEVQHLVPHGTLFLLVTMKENKLGSDSIEYLKYHALESINDITCMIVSYFIS